MDEKLVCLDPCSDSEDLQELAVEKTYELSLALKTLDEDPSKATVTNTIVPVRFTKAMDAAMYKETITGGEVER